MNGPEHYTEAEHQLRGAAETMLDFARAAVGSEEERVARDVVMAGLASAQVHATLALTAATIEAACADGSIGVRTAWTNADLAVVDL